MKKQSIKILKDYGFVIVVGIVFIGIAVYFAWDTNKDKIPGKTVDGKDVIFSSNDYNFFADDYYNALYDAQMETDEGTVDSGISAIYTLFQTKVLEQAIETTEEMEEDANELAQQYEQTYEATYGEAYESLILAQLRQVGYDSLDDFPTYFVNQSKYVNLVYDYVKENPTTWDTIYEEEAPRTISQIYVATSDPANISEAEQEKMDTILSELDSGQSFSKVAQQYSDDSLSSELGGNLGLQLSSGSLADELKEVAFALEAGQVSEEWIASGNGYYLVKVDESDKTKLFEDTDNMEAIASAVVNEDVNVFNTALWQAAEKLGITFEDEETESKLKEFMKVEDSE